MMTNNKIMLGNKSNTNTQISDNQIQVQNNPDVNKIKFVSWLKNRGLAIQNTAALKITKSVLN